MSVSHTRNFNVQSQRGSNGMTSKFAKMRSSMASGTMLYLANHGHTYFFQTIWRTDRNALPAIAKLRGCLKQCGVQRGKTYWGWGVGGNPHRCGRRLACGDPRSNFPLDLTVKLKEMLNVCDFCDLWPAGGRREAGCGQLAGPPPVAGDAGHL